MSDNKRLIKLIEYMQRQLISFPELLPDEIRNAEGKEDAWSPKDNLFHAIFWAKRRLDILETLEKGEEWEDSGFDDFEEENKLVYQEFKDHTWQDAVEMAEKTYLGMIAYLERIDEKTLLGFREGEERTIWRSIVDNFASHPMIHLWEQLVAIDRIDTLVEIFGENYFNMLLDIDESEAYQGGVYYNQACLLALTGNPQKAVEYLGKSLQMVPALVEWSTQDTDLDSLRELPAFQALYQEE